LAGVSVAIFSILLEANLSFFLRQRIPQLRNRGGRRPSPKPRIVWIAYGVSTMIFVVGTAIASSAPEPPNATSVAQIPTPTSILLVTDTPSPSPSPEPTITVTPKPTLTSTSSPTPTPAIFPLPSISIIASGVEMPGYSKQSIIVRNSQGRLTLFLRNPDGQLGYIESSDNAVTWSELTYFDQILPPGGPQLSAAIDSADQIHVVWGRGPEAGDAKYGLLDNGTWVITSTVGTGVFARDIAVDTANHPHIVWTNIDLFHVTYNGEKWIGPEKLVRGAWHPDIQINNSNDLYLFMNSASFYPTTGVAVYEMDNTGSRWNEPLQLSSSPFWSGGAAAAIDAAGDIYLVWIGASSESGGQDQVFFSRFVGGVWQTPFPIGDLNTSAGSTGAESPAIAFDANNILYVFWRGLDDTNRPVIFARALATENSNVTRVTWGWSPIIELDDPNASNVWWPSVANMYFKNRMVGVDVVWSANVGKDAVIEYSHVIYP
jgi:hypothetical protein